MLSAPFIRAFSVIVGEEGCYDATANDPGNWTGGALGVGLLGGTKYGIATSAYADNLAALPPDVRAAFPALVRDLTLAQAQTIYWYRYWSVLDCDALPVRLALIVFDAGVENGTERSANWLEGALGVHVDGDIGSITAGAAASANEEVVMVECLAQRIAFMSGLAVWQTERLGLSRRLSGLPFQAMAMQEAAVSA